MKRIKIITFLFVMCFSKKLSAGDFVLPVVLAAGLLSAAPCEYQPDNRVGNITGEQTGIRRSGCLPRWLFRRVTRLAVEIPKLAASPVGEVVAVQPGER